MAVQILSYVERESPVHRLTGSAKLICFLLWSSAAMITYDTRLLGVLFLFSLVVFAVSKVKFRDVSFVVLFIAIFMVLNNIAVYLFSPQEGVQIYGASHELFHIAGRYNVTLEQLFYQFNITLKYSTVIPASLIFIVTTNPSEFASSLNRIGVNYRIAYAVALTLRYIPDVQRDYRNIALAQQARGIDLSRKEKLHKLVKNAVAIIVPLIFSSLDRIDVISNAMELRGFGKDRRRTWYSARPFRWTDYAAMALAGLVLIASILLTFRGESRFYNPF